MTSLEEVTKNVDWKKAAKAAAATILAYGGYRFIRFLIWRERMIRRFPGPKPSLLTGNIKSFVEAGGFNERFFKTLHQKYGPVAAFFLLPNLLNVSLEDPQDQLEAYKKTEDRPKESYLFLNYLKEDTLVLSPAAAARMIRPHYAALVQQKSQLEEVRRVSFKDYRILFEKWADKEVVDVFPELGPVIYNLLGQVLFKKDFLGTGYGDEIYRLHKTLIVAVNKYLLIALLPKPVCKILAMVLKGYGEYQSSIRKFRSKLNDLIDERTEQLKAGQYADDMSALSLLCKEELFVKNRHKAVSTLGGLLNAGYDTTHSAITWVLYHLAENPKIQEKLRQDINKRFGKDGTPSDVDEVNSIEYLEAFFRESLRMRAVVPVNQRVNPREDITINGYVIPKGVNINFPMTVSFRNAKYFGEYPDSFIGDSDQARRARRCIVPFGEWTRMCIGWKFASVEIRCFVIALLQKYRVKLDNPDEPGSYDIEAGVNQPFPKFKLRFYRI